MINLTQVILVVVITTLTILLTFIGIQVVYILKDLRETLHKVNKIVGQAESLTTAISKPITGISSLVEGIQSSMKIAELLGYVKKNAKSAIEELPEKISEMKSDLNNAIHQPEESEKSVEPPKSSPAHTTSAVKRFFHRSGTPLG
ncbi:hypothetical protein HZB78_01580 [Candidatus Collierbacteria bacterium]|nr:hypothetical protein [Candidatus Collierbacteria bacterium]